MATLIFADTNDLFQAAAKDFADRAMDILNKKKMINIALSGGSTPKDFFKVLAKQKIAWEKIRFFFVDERYVSADNPDNNYYMANQYLFSQISIPKENIYPMPTTFKNPEEAAQEYEFTLRKAFGIKSDEIPQFDMIYLGLGDDAHTASLMPFNNLIVKKHQLVASCWVSKLNMHRITLTPAIINYSDNIIFMVAGKNKAKAVFAVLKGKHDPDEYPAQLIDCKAGKTIWYLDEAAAALL